MLKAVGIIPSRYSSRRFPGKPLAKLRGVPIVVRVLNQARKSQYLARVVVATDDERILEVVEEYGGEAILTRGDFACGSDRVAAAARNFSADIVLNIQGDEPLIRPEVLDQVVEILSDNDRAVMSSVCCRIKEEIEYHDPNVVKVTLGINGRALYFSRSPIPYLALHSESAGRRHLRDICYRHIGVYGFRYDFLQKFAALKQTQLELAESLEQLRALEHGYDIYCAVTEQPFSGIDTPADLEKAEKLLGA